MDLFIVEPGPDFVIASEETGSLAVPWGDAVVAAWVTGSGQHPPATDPGHDHGHAAHGHDHDRHAQAADGHPVGVVDGAVVDPVCGMSVQPPRRSRGASTASSRGSTTSSAARAASSSSTMTRSASSTPSTCPRCEHGGDPGDVRLTHAPDRSPGAIAVTGSRSGRVGQRPPRPAPTVPRPAAAPRRLPKPAQTD